MATLRAMNYYFVQSKLSEIKEAATALLIFSILSGPIDPFTLIPGCILACKWAKCCECCCECKPMDEDPSHLRARAEESKGCGPKAIVFLAISVFLEFGALTLITDALILSGDAVTTRWMRLEADMRLFGLAIVFGFHLVVTALPALVYAIKLHFKVVELITYLKNEGDIEANAATITASASPVPQNTAAQSNGRSGRTPPPPPPPGFTGTYQHPPQQAAAQTGVQMEVRDLSCELGEQPQVLAVC